MGEGSKSRKRMSRREIREASFIHADHSAPLMALMPILTRPLLRLVYGVRGPEYREPEVEALQSRRHHRMFFVSNHPANSDPLAALDLLYRRLGSRTAIASKLGNFKKGRGAAGWLMQRFGAFSVDRGKADVHYLREAARVLKEPSGKVLLFAEGGSFSRYDRVFPFLPTSLAPAFMALKELRKDDPSASLLLQPIAVVYRFRHSMYGEIKASLNRLAAALGVELRHERNLLQNIAALGHALMVRVEQECGLPPGEHPEDIEELYCRINRVRGVFLANIADALEYKVSPTIRLAMDEGRWDEVVRDALNHFYRANSDILEPGEAAHAVSEERYRRALKDLDRLRTWIAVSPRYLTQVPETGRVVDTLSRMEREVFGKRIISGKRICVVRIAPPVELGDYMEGFQADKDATLREISELAQGAIQRMLDEKVF